MDEKPNDYKMDLHPTKNEIGGLRALYSQAQRAPDGSYRSRGEIRRILGDIWITGNYADNTSEIRHMIKLRDRINRVSDTDGVQLKDEFKTDLSFTSKLYEYSGYHRNESNDPINPRERPGDFDTVYAASQRILARKHNKWINQAARGLGAFNSMTIEGAGLMLGEGYRGHVLENGLKMGLKYANHENREGIKAEDVVIGCLKQMCEILEKDPRNIRTSATQEERDYFGQLAQNLLDHESDDIRIPALSAFAYAMGDNSIEQIMYTVDTSENPREVGNAIAKLEIIATDKSYSKLEELSTSEDEYISRTAEEQLGKWKRTRVRDENGNWVRSSDIPPPNLWFSGSV